MIDRNSPVEATEEYAAAIFEDLFGYKPKHAWKVDDSDETYTEISASAGDVRGPPGKGSVVEISCQQDFNPYDRNALEAGDIHVYVGYKGSIVKLDDTFGQTVGETIAQLKGKVIALQK